MEKAKQQIRPMLFLVLWIVVTASSIYLTTHIWLLSNSLDFRYLGAVALVVGTLQGLILLSHTKRVFPWAFLTTVGTILGGWLGGMAGSILLLPAGFLGIAFGCGLGGAVLGCGQWLVLKRFPNSKWLLLFNAIAMAILLPGCIILSWQMGDPYTEDPSISDWMQTAALISMIASTIQGAGVLYVLESTQPLKLPQRYESKLLPQRPLLSPSIHQVRNQFFLWLLWVGSTALGASLWDDVQALSGDFFIFLFPVIIGVLQGLVLSFWYKKAWRWVLFTTLAGSFGILFGLLINIPIAFFAPIAFPINALSSVLYLLPGFLTGSLFLGFAQSFALRGLPQAKLIIGFDVLAVGIMLPYIIIMTTEPPQLSIAMSLPSISATDWLIGGVVGAIQGIGITYALNQHSS